MNLDLNNENILTEKSKRQNKNHNSQRKLKKTLNKINNYKSLSKSNLLLNKENVSTSLISKKFKNLLLKNIESEKRRKNILFKGINSSYTYLTNHNISNVLNYKNYLQYFKFENIKNEKGGFLNNKLLNLTTEINLKKFYYKKKKREILLKQQTSCVNDFYESEKFINFDLIKKSKFLSKPRESEKRIKNILNKSEKSLITKKLNVHKKNILSIPYMTKIKPYKNFCDAKIFLEPKIKKRKKREKNIKILNSVNNNSIIKKKEITFSEVKKKKKFKQKKKNI